jgi:hypothetical protein
MAERLYMMPLVVWTNPEGKEYRSPKYLASRFNPSGTLPFRRYHTKDYGKENMALVYIITDPADDSTHTALAGYADVYQFPENQNLDGTMGLAERNELTAFAEAALIAADWLGPQDTFRTAARTIAGMFLSFQAYREQTNESPLDNPGIFNTQFRNWPQYVQDAFTAVWVQFDGDPTDIRPNWTGRILIKALADLWQAKSLNIGPLVL